MAILITELAINADGNWAVEITNTGADISLDGVNLPGSGGGFIFPPGTIMLSGQTITVGHTSIPGVDYTTEFFSNWASSFYFISTTVPSTATLDTVSRLSATPLPRDTVFTSDTTRTPDTNFEVGDNLSDFTQTSPFSTNTLGTPTLSCFLPGTRIATSQGPRAVETLAPGDLVLTADGRAVPVVWLGQQTVSRRIGTPPEALQPIRVTAGALGGGLPLRDLRLTADHALLLDGLLVNAGALVNGTTIRAETVAKDFTVYHVETEAHDVILAEGTPAETFIDYAGRAAFDNHADYLALHGAERIIPELTLPRVTTARTVPAELREKLARDLPGALPQPQRVVA